MNLQDRRELAGSDRNRSHRHQTVKAIGLYINALISHFTTFTAYFNLRPRHSHRHPYHRTHSPPLRRRPAPRAPTAIPIYRSYVLLSLNYGPTGPFPRTMQYESAGGGYF